MEEQTNNKYEIVAPESNFKPIMKKQKRDNYKLLSFCLIGILLIIGLAFLLNHQATIIKEEASYIGYQYGINTIIQIQNTQGQWFYFTDNNYTIGNVSVQTLCGSLG